MEQDVSIRRKMGRLEETEGKKKRENGNRKYQLK